MIKKGTPVSTVTLSTPGIESVRIASPAISVKEIPPQRNKRQHIGDKQKEKADSRSSNVWDDVEVALARA